jgi:hypothetical protein
MRGSREDVAESFHNGYGDSMPRRSAPAPTRSPAPIRRPLAVDGVEAPVELTVSARARRLTLRVDPAAGVVRVTVPHGVGEAEARRFVDRHAAWLRRRLDAVPQPRPFADGAEVPILGRAHRICHVGGRGAVRRADGVLEVGGAADHLGRRVRDFLVREAAREIAQRAHAKAARIDRRITGITLRDTRSRWGSCSAEGRLNFSWRLILAPEEVLDYVVAHEVAHLRELNHSDRFWRVCASLCDDVAGPKIWLKRHGASLHRYG